VIGSYEVRFTRSAKRALTHDLPAKVAAAAFEFIVGVLAENPERIGKQLNEPLYPLYSARRGEYRIIFGVLRQEIVIEVVSIVHRRDAYRSPGS